jgi:hypothetical protein
MHVRSAALDGHFEDLLKELDVGVVAGVVHVLSYPIECLIGWLKSKKMTGQENISQPVKNRVATWSAY